MKLTPRHSHSPICTFPDLMESRKFVTVFTQPANKPYCRPAQSSPLRQQQYYSHIHTQVTKLFSFLQCVLHVQVPPQWERSDNPYCRLHPVTRVKDNETKQSTQTLTSGDNFDEEVNSSHTNIPKQTDIEPYQIVLSGILQDTVIVWANTTTRAFPRSSNNNGYTPASLPNITSQPKDELDGNGTCVNW